MEEIMLGKASGELRRLAGFFAEKERFWLGQGSRTVDIGVRGAVFHIKKEPTGISLTDLPNKYLNTFAGA
jgi:hypothetical protein